MPVHSLQAKVEETQPGILTRKDVRPSHGRGRCVETASALGGCAARSREAAKQGPEWTWCGTGVWPGLKKPLSNSTLASRAGCLAKARRGDAEGGGEPGAVGTTAKQGGLHPAGN